MEASRCPLLLKSPRHADFSQKLPAKAADPSGAVQGWLGSTTDLGHQDVPGANPGCHHESLREDNFSDPTGSRQPQKRSYRADCSKGQGLSTSGLAVWHLLFHPRSKKGSKVLQFVGLKSI